MKILSTAKRVTKVTYDLYFPFYSDGGFAFPSDENGSIKPLTNPLAQLNYDKCLASDIEPEVRRFSHSYTERAVGLCVCGRKVTLDSFTNGCDCGRDYNMSGQLLAPRSQWGEETGESSSDILNYDYGSGW